MFLIDITAASPLSNRRLDLTFADGIRAIVDMNNVIKEYTGIFAPLLEPEYFDQVKVNAELGTIGEKGSGLDM